MGQLCKGTNRPVDCSLPTSFVAMRWHSALSPIPSVPSPCPLAPTTPHPSIVRIAYGSFGFPGTTDLGFKVRTQLLPISNPMLNCSSYGGISSAIVFTVLYFRAVSGRGICPRRPGIRFLVYAFGRGMLT